MAQYCDRCGERRQPWPRCCGWLVGVSLPCQRCVNTPPPAPDAHRVRALILGVTNDGSGRDCGYTYRERRHMAAHHDLFGFRIACRRYDATHADQGRRATRAELYEAADQLLDYYTDHNTECHPEEITK